MRRTAALIVGGGPAGAAAAITLARAGAPHLLIERTHETGDALCGGFLSWRTLTTLAAVGIEAGALNPAPIRRVRLFAGGRMAETRLPRPAIGVSRQRLDTLLLAHAARAGARIERGVAVRAIEDRVARLADGAGVAGDALLLASGKHDVRGMARPPVDGDDPTMGLRVRLPASSALDRLVGDAIELHLFDGGYAGLLRQEDGSGNLCLAVRRSRLRDAGTPHALLRALATGSAPLAARFADFTDARPIDAVANVPYGWRARAGAPGLYRLGDQAGVIPSLAGEGMGIALASGIAAARAILSGDRADWQAAFAHRLRRPIGIAARVWHLAEQPRAAAPMVATARHAPWVIRTIARLTRID